MYLSKLMGSNSLFVMIVASYKKKMIPFWVVSIVMVVPPFMDGLNMFIMENPIKMDDLGVPRHFVGNLHMFVFSTVIGKHDQQCFEGIHPMVFTSKLGWLFWTSGNRLTCVIVNRSWHDSQSIPYLIYYDIL